MVTKNYQYIAVLCNDCYLPGILALSQSLKSVNSQYPLSLLCSPEVSSDTIEILKRNNINIIATDSLYRVDDAIIADNVNGFEKWNRTFFKLNVAKLVQFEKIIVLDADMIVVKNIDHLFEHKNMSCVPAGKLLSGQENYGLNSGLMVIEPSIEMFEKLVSSIEDTKNSIGNRPIGDQDVFKFVYSDWTDNKELELPEIYNCYSAYLDTLQKNKMLKFKDIHVIHFAIGEKPWMVKSYYPLQLIHASIVEKKSISCICEIKAHLKFRKLYKKCITH